MSDEEQALEPDDQPPVETLGYFPRGHRYADFHVKITRPVTELGDPVFNAGWDILYEAIDGSAGFNHWADDLAEAAWFFRDVDKVDPRVLAELPAWIEPGQFAGVVWDSPLPDVGHHHGESRPGPA